MKEALRNILRQAISGVGHRGDEYDDVSARIEVSRTKDERFGDYSTNAALVMAKRLGKKPVEIAREIVSRIEGISEDIASCEIAGPGFINFFLSPKVWEEALRVIHDQKDDYGKAPLRSDKPILIEFVSANPTGPLHVGHGRGAAIGDSLARLLRTCGYTVQTEYYVNDAGNQMRILGRSVLLRAWELLGETIDFPEDHYKGAYITDIAKELLDAPEGKRLRDLPEEEALTIASQFAGARILDGIKEDLALFAVTHDNYFHEKTLHDTGKIASALDILSSRGKTELRDGAVWFRMDSEDDETDRVLVRASGEPTYFAADTAYHLQKLERGYGRLVDIWGSDHHGYAPRVLAAIEALGYPSTMLTILLVQFVNLIQDGKKKSMSTRSGEFVTLREVLDEVGSDAARFFFLTKRCDSHLDFDLDLAKKQSKDNPVYYVQYAHARVSAIFRIAAERGIPTDMSDVDLTLLTLPEERKIMKHLADYPDMLADAAAALEPHRLTFYLMSLATLFHAYYHDNRVLTEEAPLRNARLFLVEAVRQVVANGLGILGVSAPQRM
jgi:arginyl-tRNA synthetase|uniref:Arginine--tRNA ligase n=1 Tax=Desulfomonile tiedjei TaxID=2358 RepID=A0A7C4EW56_9BACT